MSLRKIVQIDRQKCNGCGLCVPACAEGAIRIVDGKAQLVSETYCDGLGACLGECPQGAITIVHREAMPFEEEVVKQRLATAAPGCPGSAPRSLQLDLIQPGPKPAAECAAPAPATETPSRLGHWPVQLHLVPPTAPFLQNADLLLVADCVPVAFADFHQRFLGNKPVVIGCPKLDDTNVYVEKLARMIVGANLRSLTVVHMEVPCCTGLVRIAQAAMRAAQRDIPLEEVTISIRGRIVEPGP